MHVFIVCTRNRRKELESFLCSNMNLSVKPDLILVIDSSDQCLNQNFIDNYEGINLNYIYTKEVGLTKQRNLAIKLVDETYDFLHFFDDDVELPFNYFEDIKVFIDRNPNIVGGSPLVNFKKTFAGSLLNFLYKYLNIQVEGRILYGGFNIGVFNYYNALQVDWLPGCAMFFKRKELSGIFFDETRKGYGLGEDVDFTYRLKTRGPLVVTNSASVDHKLSPVNRLNSKDFFKMDILNRRSIIRLRNRKYQFLEFMVSFLLLNALLLIKSLYNPKKNLGSLLAFNLAIYDFFRFLIKN
jgi:GT2 family glycosyltransferase